MKRLLAILSVVALGCHEGKPTAPTPPAGPPKNEPAATNSGGKDISPEEAAYRLDLADVHLKHKRFDEAMRIYQEIQKACKDEASVGRATYGVALVHIMKGELKLAIGPLAAAIQTSPKSTRPELQFMLAQVHAELGSDTAAEEILDGMIREPELSAEVRSQVYNRLAEIYVKRNNLAGLAAKLEKLAEANPKNPEYLTLLGQLYSGQLQDPKKALAVYEKLLKLAEDDPTAMQRVMESAIRAAQVDRALELMEKLLKKFEKETATQAKILKATGALLLQQKSWEKAAAVLERAEKMTTALAELDDVRMGLYSALKELGKLPDRVKELEKVVLENAKDESALRGLLLIFHGFTGATVRAEEVLGMLLALKPEDPTYLSFGVDLARQRGLHEKVVEHFEKLLGLDTRVALKFLEPYVNALKISGKLEKAAAEFQKAAERDTANRVTILALGGETLLRAGRNEDTTKLWQKMIASCKESKKGQEYLTAVVVLRRNGALKDAWEVCSEALRAGADAATLASLLLEGAEILDGLRKPEEAEKLCREVIRRTELPEDARRAAQKKLAELQQKSGRK